MIRYAVEIVSASNKKTLWVSIGTGVSPDRDDAHLYSRRQLAVKKLKEFTDYPQWYDSAKIVEVEVNWP